MARGAAPLVEDENDKPTVIALREIAEGLVDDEFMNAQERPVLGEEIEDTEAAHQRPAVPGF